MENQVKPTTTAGVKGELTYEDKVIQKIVGIALESVDGLLTTAIYDQIKEVVSTQVNKMTNLEVIEVNVNVADVKTREQFEKDSETVQDKVSSAAETTGEFASKQTRKAKGAFNKTASRIQENNEPRVQ